MKAHHKRLLAACVWILAGSLGASAQDDEPTAAPGPTSFATEPGELGALANSVNLFTGQVSLPIPLVSLPGRDGLSVAVAASYSSAGIDIDVQTWNLDAPTGILGLGWSLDYPRIVADHKGTGTLHDDEYYLIGGGSSSRLIFTSDGGSYRTYTAQGNPFQRIRYYESDERWEITDEAGVISTYGDKNDANSNVQWAVRWGNYAGNSSRASG